MGKIHKALEKSRRERQEKPQSGAYKPFDKGFSTRERSRHDTNRREADSVDAAISLQGPDLGTIHGLLKESSEERTPKYKEKNESVAENTDDDSILKKGPSSSLPSERQSKLPNETIEERDVSGVQSDDHRETGGTGKTLDAQGRTLAHNSSMKSKSPDSGKIGSPLTGPRADKEYDAVNIGKISALSQNEVNDEKVFVFKEKKLDKIDREDGSYKSITDYAHQDKTDKFNVYSSNNGTVDNSLVALLKPKSYEAEQFKILRTNLLFPESGNPARSILITSAAPTDGKSFVSANLAVSLALNNDRKVLLIDADIRRSAIHKIFGLIHVEKGICDFLTDGVPLNTLLVKTSLKNLVILPAGKRMHHANELQSLEKLHKLFEELHAKFSDYFIVVDSPPPKLASETGVLARLVDGVVVVMRSGVTKRELVEETIDLLDKGKIAGIVFNWHDSRMFNYKKYIKSGTYYS